MKDFSSLSPEDEQKFLVYEQTSQANSTKARNIGVASGLGVFIVTLIIVLSQGGSDRIEERFTEEGGEKAEKKSLGAEEKKAETPDAPKEEPKKEEAAEDGDAEAEEGGEAADGKAEE